MPPGRRVAPVPNTSPTRERIGEWVQGNPWWPYKPPLSHATRHEGARESLMRFTDGYWMAREGMHPLYAAEAYSIDVRPDRLTVTAPTQVIGRRGDTLNRPVVTVSFSSPGDGVVKVEVDHHRGGLEARPAFEIYPGGAPGTADGQVTTREDDTHAELTTGGLTVRVSKGAPWRVEYLRGAEVLTSSEPKSVGYVIADDGRTYVHEQLALGVGEYVYGLGERFGAVVKNGQSVDIWNADGGTSSEQAYKNVPFYLTNRGYGVFVNHPERVSFEIGSEVVSRAQFSVEGERLEYFVIDGPRPKDVLERYTRLTGRPARVPAWSFGLWLSTSFTTSYDEQTVTSFIDGMAERDLPLSVFHFDCFWMREFQWCDFEWDPRTFPDPEGMLARLKDRGLRICVWINPYIAQQSPLFDEGRAKGYLLRRPDGSVWQWDLWQAGMALVDFTNPEASAWFASHLARLQDMGVDAFKTDFGERVPVDDVVWHDGSDPAKMHNYYAQLYNKVVFESLEERRGDGDAVLFARAATAGGQQLPVHWGGDCYSTYGAMAETLRGGLSLAASGFGYWSHDIGGFEGLPDPGVFKRWLAFGLLSSHSRLHGSSSYRVPWAFDDEAVDVARAFTKLKLRLMPYLLRLADEAHTTGAPMIRPLLLEFPDDRAVTHLDAQYMLGDALLVAPVFRADGAVEHYLPAGTWTHLLTGEQVEGGGWVAETYGFESLPLFVRPGTVLPVGAQDSTPEYEYADGVTLRVFEVPDGYSADVVVPGADGSAPTTFTVTRTEDAVTVTTTDARHPWHVEVVGHPGGTGTADGPAALTVDLGPARVAG